MNIVMATMIAFSGIVLSMTLLAYIPLIKKGEMLIPHLISFVATLIAVLVLFKIMFLGGFTL